MIKGADSNIAALNALADRQAVTANNLANADSDNFQASTTVLVTDQANNPELRISKNTTPGITLNEADGSTHQTSNVDMATELTSMVPTQTAYSANLKALQVADEMTGTLLDLKT